MITEQRPRTTIARSLEEPQSMAAAELEADTLRAEIIDIQGQLALRPRPLMSDGLSNAEFNDWRQWHSRAAGAVRFKEARYAFLRKWIGRRQQTAQHTGRSTQELLEHMLVLVEYLAGDEDLPPEVTDALEALRDWRRQRLLRL